MATARLAARHDHLTIERAACYAKRIAALVVYVAAVLVALAIIRPALTSSSDPPPSPAGTLSARAELAEIGKGETLELIAAEHSTTVAQLIGLNPGLSPLGLEPGRQIRVE